MKRNEHLELYSMISEVGSRLTPCTLSLLSNKSGKLNAELYMNYMN